MKSLSTKIAYRPAFRSSAIADHRGACHAIRSTPKETALLNKLDRLPISTRRVLHPCQFDLSNSRVLCWIHVVNRNSQRYTMQCNVREGVLYVSYKACKADGKPCTC